MHVAGLSSSLCMKPVVKSIHGFFLVMDLKLNQRSEHLSDQSRCHGDTTRSIVLCNDGVPLYRLVIGLGVEGTPIKKGPVNLNNSPDLATK